MSEGELFAHSLAPAIRGHRLTLVRLLFLATIAAGACGCLARKVYELLEMGIILKAGMDQILRSTSIDLKIGLFSYSLRDPCQMEHLIDPFDCLNQRRLVATIARSPFDGKTLQPLQIARFADQTADLHPSLEQSIYKVTADKACSPCDQGLQGTLSFISWKEL